MDFFASCEDFFVYKDPGIPTLLGITQQVTCPQYTSVNEVIFVIVAGLYCQ